MIGPLGGFIIKQGARAGKGLVWLWSAIGVAEGCGEWPVGALQAILGAVRGLGRFGRGVEGGDQHLDEVAVEGSTGILRIAVGIFRDNEDIVALPKESHTVAFGFFIRNKDEWGSKRFFPFFSCLFFFGGIFLDDVAERWG